MKKLSLYLFPLLAAAALGLWYYDNSTAPLGSFFSDRDGLIMAAGRLAAILGALGVMGQLLVMSRAPWLEPLTGSGLPVKWHHRAGLAVPLALLVHPPLVVWHHARAAGISFAEQYRSVLGWEDVAPAAAGEALIIAAVLLSLPFIRRRLSYGAWHKTHLAVYLGLALSIGHQLELGGDLSAEKPYFAWVWYALLAFTGANAAWFRLIKPRLPKTA
ncbi:MAG: ferric reductase-like transmembrane domain-containing protein [Elusimicrobiales bacterium]|nr:ferric reductase-like transmembrane domain-containing protein [Elusimicrobiales bacterium]